MNDATMMISTTLRAARAATQRASSATSRRTSWTPRGTISGAGGAGGSSPPCSSTTATCSSVLICGSMASVSASARILFCGDLVGSAGRQALLWTLPALRERYDPTFVVVNGENVAGGFGITPDIARELLGAGVDVITLGNHAYRRREIYPYLDVEPRIVRPANYLAGQPGRGHTVVERDGVRLAVVNLSGNVFMTAGRSAFAEADALVAKLTAEADHILIDMHAEATS